MYSKFLARAGVHLVALAALLGPFGTIPWSSAADASDALIGVRLAGLPEPFVASRSTTAEETAALNTMLGPSSTLSISGTTEALEIFAIRNPNSGWTAGVWANLGAKYYHDGHFSKALEAWQKSWTLGKDATQPEARAMIDGAVSNLAGLYANLGQMDKLSALLTEIADRPISGSATEEIQGAAELLKLSRTDPRHLFICGPLALKALALAEGVKPAQVDFLQWYRADANGTNFEELKRLAKNLDLNPVVVHRSQGQAVPIPSIVHWKLGHFAAIVGKANGRYHVIDSVFPSAEIWVTAEALDEEASGYFMIAGKESLSNGWQLVPNDELAGIWGKGPSTQTRKGDAGDKGANGQDDGAPALPGSPPTDPTSGPFAGAPGFPPTIPLFSPPATPPFSPPKPDCPMCSYNIKESSVSLYLSDSPVGYEPPIGPSASIKISYNQREDSQPQIFSFFNLGPKWTFNWLTYITDDPTNPGASVSRYLPDGGAFYYLGYNSGSQTFSAQDTDGSVLVLVSQSPVVYQRKMRNGSVETFSQSDGSSSFPRRIFLTKLQDPQGNSVQLNYDASARLTSLIDATGRSTTFSYDLSTQPLKVTKMTDPFGRSAGLTYDSDGRLTSITDIIGIKSSFTYDANSLVNSMTTPYGTTSFAYTAPGTSNPPRFVQVTDPLGLKEREEWVDPAPVPDMDPSSTVPAGMPYTPTNQYLNYRNSLHWDKSQYIAAGCTDSGGCNYNKGRIRHFLHMTGSQIKGTTVESLKNPLENRVWYQYPGQTSTIYVGSFDSPIAIGRVLDDGATQLTQYAYDATSFFNLTRVTDPSGRVTNFAYANDVDLAAISQTTEYGFKKTIAQFVYNGQHLPLSYTDAAGQKTNYTYNAAGQMTSTVNPLNHVTTFNYAGNGNLVSIINANNQTAATYTYDAANRIASYTDSEGWTVAYEYDAADRITKATYPDGSSETYSYDRLDLASYTDRLGRTTTYQYDANRRLTKATDPSGHAIQYDYTPVGATSSLTDAKGNVTSWAYDLQSRPISKQYADNSSFAYNYETTTSRLQSTTDALGQVRHLTYAVDNGVTNISYSNTINTTPSVSFAWDPFFKRLASMTDGIGTTSYSYGAPFQPGALQRTGECFVPTSSSTCAHQIAYDYDELGRISSRSVSGAGTETYQYDAIGRVSNHLSDLGDFALNYLGETNQIALRKLAGSDATLQTSWSYLPNSGDRRLAGINNTGLSTSQFSNFAFTTNSENEFTAITETTDASVAAPDATNQNAIYNNLNQLTNLSSQAQTYDANGNLLNDGPRSYAWDAENRLISITYSSESGKATNFAYDGIGRRIGIISTPAGGGTATTRNFVWCGNQICQARDASYALTRQYFEEGEYLAGSTPKPYFYGIDQIGSVRRVFTSTSSAPAYAYDPYGVPLQTTTPVTDFGYAGMFANPESGLNLTWYRAYDPGIGRWISRDPAGEVTDQAGNLYAYVDDVPIQYVDPKGLAYKCEGVCAAGGSYGTTPMFCVFGKNVCRDCAVKLLGIGDEAAEGQTKILKQYERR
ncbi:peptidase C39 [Agrobacterium vitis]|uniref:RHS repeat-associated core domain-containing protein n=1 Tax=Agrobacterium vitis TaxID=373 RepID=UPI0012E7BA10|nr:RHS repeat-associated core domain-containing protein [Agrobacterium vitis]MVA82646.1 peptidase C39 [Agrobacterium vitis]